MSGYDTQNLVNFTVRDPAVRLANKVDGIEYDVNNLNPFQRNIQGNKSVSWLGTGYTPADNGSIFLSPFTPTGQTPDNPYVVNLGQLMNPNLWVYSFPDYDAFIIDEAGDRVLDPELVTKYYIQIPGSESGTDPVDVQVFQALKATFGFDQIPVGFFITQTYQVGQGTQIWVCTSDITPTSEADYIFFCVNKFDYIPNFPFPEEVGDLVDFLNIAVSPSTIPYWYDFNSDEYFYTNFPAEYATPACLLTPPEHIRPPNYPETLPQPLTIEQLIQQNTQGIPTVLSASSSSSTSVSTLSTKSGSRASKKAAKKTTTTTTTVQQAPKPVVTRDIFKKGVKSHTAVVEDVPSRQSRMNRFFKAKLTKQ